MLNVSEHRAVSGRALADGAFRAALLADPAAAVAEAIGRPIDPSVTVSVLEESAARPAFVLPVPAAIEAELPAATDARSATENAVYAMLRDDPLLIEDALRDPAAFLRTRLGIEIGRVDLRRETPDSLIVVIPNPAAHEELDDAMLDLVAGGNSGDNSDGGKVG